MERKAERGNEEVRGGLALLSWVADFSWRIGGFSCWALRAADGFASITVAK